MKTESTISKIQQELISMFASLDAWFDKLMDDGFDPDQEINTLEVVEHILSSNYNVLNVLPMECDNALELLERDFQAISQPRTMDELRFALRDQLYQSLCLIDSLDDSVARDPFSHDKQMDLRDKLFAIAQHLRYHLEELEKVEA
ncbi:MAG TPA: DinB family protein [Chryseosolibacter sp.]